MDFDEILLEIGEFGKFQFLNYFAICLPIVYVAANSLSYVFATRSPNYRCFVPECESVGSTSYQADWVKDVLPGAVAESSGNFMPELCFKYLPSNNTLLEAADTCVAEMFGTEREQCNQWVFDENERTIVNDWSLTCDENLWKLALVGTVHFAGVMTGSGLFGILADYYGRKMPLLVAIVIMSTTGIAQALSPNYIWFLIFAFLNAVGSSGVYPAAFVMCFELVGKSKRVAASVFLNYFFAIGEALTGVIAWLDHDWVHLQYWVSVPPLMFVAYYWFIPESARWLLAKKRNQQAFKIIRKAARINGVKLSQSILSKFEQDARDEEFAQEIKSLNSSQAGEKIKVVTYKELLKSKILVIRCLIFFFIWGTNAFVFYGLSLNSVNLSGNIYMNYILSALSEIPGNFIAHIVIIKFGRKMSQISALLVCGIVCIAGGFVPEKYFWLQIILSVMGKMTITTSFTIVFLFASEMLPTLIRSGVIGTLSTLSRSGALLAPFIPLLRIISPYLPLLTFGSVAFLAGLSAIFLPETLGTRLPDTIEEAENIGKKKPPRR